MWTRDGFETSRFSQEFQRLGRIVFVTLAIATITFGGLQLILSGR